MSRKVSTYVIKQVHRVVTEFILSGILASQNVNTRTCTGLNQSETKWYFWWSKNFDEYGNLACTSSDSNITKFQSDLVHIQNADKRQKNA